MVGEAPPANPEAEAPPQRRLGATATTWLVIIAVHLAAFLAFYLVTVRFLESEISANAEKMARTRLSETANELHIVAKTYTGDQPGGHLFDDILEAHTSLSYRLFAPTGKLVGGADGVADDERVEILDFLVGDERQLIWRSPDKHQVEGLVRLVADADCLPCHALGSTRGVISLNVDFSETLQHVRAKSHRDIGFLVLAWAVFAMVSYGFLHRSVRRWISRLEAALDADDSGAAGALATGLPLVLDPVSAELQDALKQFLERQRQQRAAMTSRLAHTDKLASLGQLAADLALQVRDPIAGVLGALRILQEDATDEASRRLCDEMITDLERADGTLQALLSSAQPSPPCLATVDIRNLVWEVGRMMDPVLEKAGVLLKTEMDSDPLEAVVDAAKIRQVLIALVQNASAAAATSPRGLIHLKAGWLPGLDGLILTVGDNGPGIAAADHAKIFEPFYSTVSSSTGLGLANARSLVEQHGGSLQVESAEGEGATFFVILPAPQPEQPEPPDTR